MDLSTCTGFLRSLENCFKPINNIGSKKFCSLVGVMLNHLDVLISHVRNIVILELALVVCSYCLLASLIGNKYISTTIALVKFYDLP